jgi:hypothetical protein
MPVDISNLAPTVAIVAIFIWYLNKRDNLLQDIVNNLGMRLDKLSDVIASLERRIAGVEKTRIEEKNEEK